MRETAFHQNGDSSAITIQGTLEEVEAFRAMMAGVKWLGVQDGKLRVLARIAEVPPPIDDPVIPPTWAIAPVPQLGKCTDSDIAAAERDRQLSPKPTLNVAPDINPTEGWHSPSFYLQHLCGYNWTPENYKREAAKLTAIGFECMRSRRGRDGRFWEVWYLPFTMAAKGDLKAVIEMAEKARKDWRDWETVTRAVVDWLCKNIGFGTLNVAIQRAAMTVD